MEPLDLTQRPPRGPREQLLGLYFLPRTIDKIRGELPGGSLGAYFVDYPGGLSAYLLHKIRVDVGALRQAVAEADDEAAVAAWLERHADLSAAESANARMSNLTIGIMPPQTRAFFDSLYGDAARVPEDTLIFDVLERDDARLAAAT